MIMEKLVQEDRRGPVWALMQSLNMLTCTEGKERTLTEYETLLKRAGFANWVVLLVLGTMHFFNMLVLHLMRRPLRQRAVPPPPFQPGAQVNQPAARF